MIRPLSPHTALPSFILTLFSAETLSESGSGLYPPSVEAPVERKCFCLVAPAVTLSVLHLVACSKGSLQT